jgi:chromosome segregation ATPase
MKKILVVLMCGLAVFTSCVSKSDYNYAADEAIYWENEYENKCDEYEILRQKYNQLVDEYNDLLSESQEKENIINRAKNSVRKLKSDFDSFRRGWGFYNANDIESDINRVENNLNGWW